VRVALDTNRLTLRKSGFRCLCLGFHGGGRQRRNEVLLQRLLAKTTVAVLYLAGRPRSNTRVCAQLKRAGTPIPDNDLWIAALVLEHNLLLITRDRHFERIPQLMRG
jgi:tRNA(fMet)-specific endonuclease VapC